MLAAARAFAAWTWPRRACGKVEYHITSMPFKCMYLAHTQPTHRLVPHPLHASCAHSSKAHSVSHTLKQTDASPSHLMSGHLGLVRSASMLV
jgi:hypothetical protein